jgi:hypothetical protein
MTQVNSPYLLSKVRPLNPAELLESNYFDELERILQQLYRRSGAEADTSDTQRNLPPVTAGALPAYHNNNYYSISSAHTTAGDQRLIATSTLTITLNSLPQDQERVRVKVSGDITVTVDGNGTNINGDSNAILYIDQTLVDFVYYAELGEWVVE